MAAVEAERIMAKARAIRNLTLAAVAGAMPQELTYRPEGRWSARDVLIHVGNWEEEAVVYLDCLVHGKPFPEFGAKDIDEWNEQHLARFAGLDVAGAIEYLAGTRKALAEGAAALTDEQLRTNEQFIPLLLMTPDHEIGHLYQMREAIARARGDHRGAAVAYLAYARERILCRVNLEYRPVASLLWRPQPEAWSIQDVLIHLSVWDRWFADWLSARADGRPAPGWPYPEGQLDEWNRAQVEVRRHESVAHTLHELGGVRGEVLAALSRLSQEQVAAAEVQEELKGFREHDDHHMHQILKLLQGWRESQQA